MCNCISYNRPDLCAIDGKVSVMLKPPAWSSRDSICIDACIADAIKMLWANDIVTAGSCCGHNGAFGYDGPNVVLDSAADAYKALDLLTAFDSRPWEVLQWRLYKITNNNR